MRVKHYLAAAIVLTGALGFTLVDARAETLQATAENQLFELPSTLEAGDDKEVSVLLDASHLKLALVTLRRGTELPAHSTPVPATVLVLEGDGVIHVADEAMTVTRGSLVSLAAGVEHDVVPAPGSNMRLLVHYLRGATGTAEPPHAAHDN